MDTNSRATRLLLTIPILLGVACEDATFDDGLSNLATGSVERTPPEETPSVGSITVQLLSPGDSTLVVQNDSTIGCELNVNRGYGLQIRFEWIDSNPSPAAGGYHLFVKSRTATFPLINTDVLANEFTYLSCNGFVIDRNLGGWEWHVQSLDESRNPVGSSEVWIFGFQPCRLEDGRSCNAPAGP